MKFLTKDVIKEPYSSSLATLQSTSSLNLYISSTVVGMYSDFKLFIARGDYFEEKSQIVFTTTGVKIAGNIITGHSEHHEVRKRGICKRA